jgi:Flp pilus assembly protein TadG
MDGIPRGRLGERTVHKGRLALGRRIDSGLTVGARRRRVPAGDRGAAVVEFVLVSIPLLFLLLAVLQVAVYLHVRNVVVASAAEGARYGANGDRASADGGPYAEQVLGRGLAPRTAAGVRCAADEEPGDGGTVLVAVRCRGAVPTLLSAAGRALPVNATAHAIKEGR